MADDQDTPEVASIKSRIQSLLDSNKNKLDIDLTKDVIEFKPVNASLFTGSNSQATVSLGFKDENLKKDSSLDQLRSSFDFIALDRLPVPGLEGVPSQWQIYPQTSTSSFSEGVTLDQYDAKTQTLQITVKTQFFAIYGTVPQKNPIACSAAPKGTYLQVRRDIEGVIKLSAKLSFN